MQRNLSYIRDVLQEAVVDARGNQRAATLTVLLLLLERLTEAVEESSTDQIEARPSLTVLWSNLRWLAHRSEDCSPEEWHTQVERLAQGIEDLAVLVLPDEDEQQERRTS